MDTKDQEKLSTLLKKVNKAVENSKGNVICIEKKTKLTYDITSRARLIAADSFGINGFDAYTGFVSGICASDNDITDVLADATQELVK